MSCPRLEVLLACILAWAAIPWTAAAHQNPTGCDDRARPFTFAVVPDKRVVRPGETVNLALEVTNDDIGSALACDLTGATVTLVLPARDGTASGEVKTFGPADYPAGTRPTVVATVPYTVAVDPGVSAIGVDGDVVGTYHTGDLHRRPDRSDHLLIGVTQPHTTLTVNASPADGRAPLTVTYTYTEVNDSSTDAPISGVTVADDLCSPVTRTGGDVNGNEVLDVGETWTYTCTRTFTEPGTYVNHVQATGINVPDDRPHPVENAEARVQVRNPHTTLTVTPEPSSGVAPLTVTYTYREVNDGTDAISGVTLADDLCSPLTPTGGDANGNEVLDVGETWTYTCTRTFTEPGTYVNHVVGTGVDVIDGQPHPEERAEAIVTVERQPSPTPSPGESPVSSPSPEVSPAVLGVEVERLPETGADVLPAAGAAGIALLAGGALLALARRRRGRPERPPSPGP